MGGTSSNQQQQQTQSQSNPWAPTQPALTGLINSLGPSTPSPGQRTAANNLVGATGNLPNFTGQATGATNAFLGGDPTGLLGPAYQNYQNQVNPIANASLDPMSNPYTAQALQVAQNDIRDQVNQNFAGAGRDLSGMNTQALGRGEMQALAPILLGQYNTNVGNRLTAGTDLFNAGQNTAGAEAGNIGQGFGMASSIPGLTTQNAEAQLGAANTKRMLPLSNASALSSILLPIAGLGGQTSGSGNMSGSNTMSPIAQFQGLFGGNAMANAGRIGLGGLGILGNGIGQGLFPNGLTGIPTA